MRRTPCCRKAYRAPPRWKTSPWTSRAIAARAWPPWWRSTGDIEGRIILDLEPQTAVRVASHYAGADLPESDSLIKETIFELANQVVGNAVSALNDQGFHFRVHPPM